MKITIKHSMPDCADCAHAKRLKSGALYCRAKNYDIDTLSCFKKRMVTEVNMDKYDGRVSEMADHDLDIDDEYADKIKDLEKRLAEEKDRAEAWELRCEELEQELRDAQAQLDESVRKEARLGLEANKLRDRIGEQNWTIGCYDQENRELRGKLVNAEAKRDDYHQLADFHLDENVKLYRRREALENENGELRGKLEKAEAEAKELRDQLAEKTTFCEMLKKNCHEYEVLRDKLQEAQKHAVKELECLKERGYLAWKTYFEPCAEPSDIDADLTTRAREIHQIAVDHGWYDPDEDGRQRSFPEIAMLCVCELAEAVESYRKGEPPVFFKPVGDDSKRQKPEGYAVEMMDCVIRILDWFGYAENEKLFSETPDEVMDTKCEYNKTRPYRHGGKKL